MGSFATARRSVLLFRGQPLQCISVLLKRTVASGRFRADQAQYEAVAGGIGPFQLSSLRRPRADFSLGLTQKTVFDDIVEYRLVLGIET